jgi:hypothetical protein
MIVLGKQQELTVNQGRVVMEIINNTRGGIVILIQSKKGNAAIGGHPDVYSCFHW